MGTNVFISFRYSDGATLKNELESIFDSSTDVISRSENVDRSEMSDETIRDYLYKKLKQTSVTIVLLTPKAVNYKKNIFGDYDDWLYDELRYSLEDRYENKTNGVVAVYTDKSEYDLYKDSTHTCDTCNETRTCRTILNFNNLVRKNVLNIKEYYKSESCKGLYDSTKDSYISMVHIDEFKKNPSKYVEEAKEKRDRINQFEISKKM